jgi:hypothetical protein
MGLDMFAYRIAIDAERAMPDVDAIFTDSDSRQADDGSPLFRLIDGDFYYWRKHPDLHGWMEQLYRRKGGLGNSFNCRTVRLQPDDLDALQAIVNRQALPHTTGFFFGQSSPDDRENDLAFIAKARDAIAAGDAVYYDSWWEGRVWNRPGLRSPPPLALRGHRAPEGHYSSQQVQGCHGIATASRTTGPHHFPWRGDGGISPPTVVAAKENRDPHRRLRRSLRDP